MPATSRATESEREREREREREKEGKEATNTDRLTKIYCETVRHEEENRKSGVEERQKLA